MAVVAFPSAPGVGAALFALVTQFVRFTVEPHGSEPIRRVQG